MKQPKPFIVHKPAPVRADCKSSFCDRFICVTCGRTLDSRKLGKRCKGAKP